jgi:early secretory antigenic target protein ESAT-6
VLVVDFAALKDLSTSIEESIEQAEEILATLKGQLASLAETWTGAAAEGFQATFARWSASEQDLREQVRGLLDLVVTAHDNHAQAVRRNTAMWQG